MRKLLMAILVVFSYVALGISDQQINETDKVKGTWVTCLELFGDECIEINAYLDVVTNMRIMKIKYDIPMPEILVIDMPNSQLLCHRVIKGRQCDSLN